MRVLPDVVGGAPRARRLLVAGTAVVLMTVAAAWVRPWYMDGRRAKAYTVRSTMGWPMVR